LGCDKRNAHHEGGHGLLTQVRGENEITMSLRG
jgi:hypothetical protein